MVNFHTTINIVLLTGTVALLLALGYAAGYTHSSNMLYPNARQLDERLYEPTNHHEHNLHTETRELNGYLQDILLFMEEARQDAELRKALNHSRDN